MDTLISVRFMCRVLFAQAALTGMLVSPVASQGPGTDASLVGDVPLLCNTGRQAYQCVLPPTCLATSQSFAHGRFCGTVTDNVSQGRASRRRIAAGIGAVVGASATYFALNSGGSTSLCDKSANQDATSTGTCVGLYVLGGLAGAGVGLVTIGLVTSDADQDGDARSLRVGLQFNLGH